MEVLKILQTQMGTPLPWHFFHIFMFSLSIIATILLCVFAKNVSEKKFRIIIFVTWIIFILFEAYKELTYCIQWNFDDAGKLINISYRYEAFPFQFCSMPFYLYPFIAFLPNGKIRDALMSFVSTFVLVAGIVVMLKPETVFASIIGINIQTMIHHGLQIVTGVYVTIFNADKYKEPLKNVVKYFLGGFIVFILLALLALILNEVVYSSGVLNGAIFNMFFISRHFVDFMPVAADQIKLLPYPVFLIGYFAIFSLLSFITTLTECLLIKLFSK